MQRPRRSLSLRPVPLALLVLTAATVAGVSIWLFPAPEPREPSLVIVDTPGERDELERALREGRVRLPTREEFDAMLTPEQRELAGRGSVVASPR